MRRLSVAALALVLALVLAPPALGQSWYDAYSRGVAAVRAKNWAAGAEALQKAIAEMPVENAKLRANREFITYMPHFWLGIAKVGLNEPDAALAELRLSEEQGVVQNTPFYGQMREWIAQAQQLKKRNAENAAAGSRRNASAAIAGAVSAQGAALSAGADRNDAYRAAQRKLQEAQEAFNRAGTDVRAYGRAGDLAGQARDMFAAAAEAARKAKAARAAPRPQPPQIVQKAPPREMEIPFEGPPPKPKPAVTPPVAPPVVAPPVVAPPVVAPPVITKAEADARVAERDRPKPAAKLPPPPVRPPAPAVDTRAELEAAYRVYAAGDLAGAEARLTSAIAKASTAEAYLLRGCTRYTRGMLSRRPDALLGAAAEDFRRALRMNAALRLSERSFSPKLVAFFEKVRGQY